MNDMPEVLERLWTTAQLSAVLGQPPGRIKRLKWEFRHELPTPRRLGGADVWDEHGLEVWRQIIKREDFDRHRELTLRLA